MYYWRIWQPIPESIYERDEKKEKSIFILNWRFHCNSIDRMLNKNVLITHKIHCVFDKKKKKKFYKKVIIIFVDYFSKKKFLTREKYSYSTKFDLLCFFFTYVSYGKNVFFQFKEQKKSDTTRINNFCFVSYTKNDW